MRVVYSRHYNIGFFGLERLHPFDSRKYGRAWKLLKGRFGYRLRSIWIKPRREASPAELKLVHSDAYLDRLRNSTYLSSALEIPEVGRIPNWLADWLVLRPMRWATRGTIEAAEASLRHGFAVNLSGGYHHAKPEQGEGFCTYSDIAIAVESLRKDNLITKDARIAYIDTDAHQGNGVCHTFAHDNRVFIFDMYNDQIYPSHDVEAQDRIDCSIRISPNTRDSDYLGDLTNQLPRFLDSVSKTPIGLAIYNAGTDVLAGDPLGNLSISADAIFQRDLFVVKELRDRSIPTVMLLSGGYTRESYRIVARSVIQFIENES